MSGRPGSSKLVARWIALTVAASVIAAIDGGWLATWTTFAPSRIWRGEVWRLVTWVFVEGSPFQLLLTCVAIYHFGGELLPRWGERRMRRFLLEVLGGSAAIAAVLALVSRDLWFSHRFGGWAVADALVIAWARQYPDSTLVLYGLLRLRGRELIRIVVGITAVYAVFAGIFTWSLELVVCAAAYWYPGQRLGRPA
jgi:membrane associated rhomboid family serine protease